MGVEVDVTIRGATPEKEAWARDILSWPEVPPLKRPITITFQDSGGFQAGLTGFWVEHQVHEMAFLHELGHTWSDQRFDFSIRFFLRAILFGDGNEMGPGWTHGAWNDRPTENWADAFAKYILETHYPGSTHSSWTRYSNNVVRRIIAFVLRFRP